MVRLIPPIYVKPFVKRHKNDAADAEAIVEAASRPTMRFVAVKSEAQQARAMLFRALDLLVRQRTQLINALRGHLAEHGVVAAHGPAHVKRLADAIANGDSGLPIAVRELGELLLEQIAALDEKTGDLDKRLREAAGREGATKRLQTMPGVGPVTATAVETFAPPMEVFRRGRDFAAWLGLVPIQRSTGGKPRLGNLQDGPAGYPQALDHRRDVGRAGGRTLSPARELLARAHARPEAAHVGRAGAC